MRILFLIVYGDRLSINSVIPQLTHQVVTTLLRRHRHLMTSRRRRTTLLRRYVLTGTLCQRVFINLLWQVIARWDRSLSKSMEQDLFVRNVIRAHTMTYRAWTLSVSRARRTWQRLKKELSASMSVPVSRSGDLLKSILWKFWDKIFLFLHLNKRCGYSLEALRRDRKSCSVSFYTYDFARILVYFNPL